MNQTLEQIHATQPRCIIFNKVDVLSESEIIKLRDTYEKLSPIFVSTISGYGIDDLKRALWDATKQLIALSCFKIDVFLCIDKSVLILIDLNSPRTPIKYNLLVHIHITCSNGDDGSSIVGNTRK